MSTPLTYLIVAGFLSTAAAGAQARPDFTGTWTRAPEGAPTVATTGDAGFRVGDMGNGWGTPLTITQRPDSIIVEYVFFSSYDLQPPVRFAYATDGSESPNTIMLGHAPSLQRGRVGWQDRSLVITTLHPVPPGATSGKPVEVTQTLTLASRTSLIVETTRPGTKGPETIRTAYTRR